MKYILATLVIAWMMVFVRNSNAVDFSQRDKQAHALMGCGVASMVRGFATDGFADHPVLWGMGAGIGAGVLYELATPASSNSIQERKQDVLATGIGALACIGIAEGVKLMLDTHRLSLQGEF